jgi:hypothetical protein
LRIGTVPHAAPTRTGPSGARRDFSAWP